MCLYQTTRINPKYKPNKKNKGIVPPFPTINGTVRLDLCTIQTQCGRCMECYKAKANGYKIRLAEHIKIHKNGKFTLLTLSDEHYFKLDEEISYNIQGYERDNAILTLAMRRFLERWRWEFKTSVMHFFVSELGQTATERPHMHGILWTNQPWETIERLWKYGYVGKGKWKNDKLVNYVGESTIEYIAKYITKVDVLHKEYRSIILTSKGIGANYISSTNAQRNKYKPRDNIKGIKTNENYKHRSGFETGLPPYLKNKILTEEEREIIRCEKKDSGEVWVNKTKLINPSQEIIEAVRNTGRQLNKQLGYGNDEKNWNQKLAEEERRQILRDKQRAKVIQESKGKVIKLKSNKAKKTG